MVAGDKDYFNLGTVFAGETMFLSVRLPDSGLLKPIVEIRDANNNVVSIAPNPSSNVARYDVTQTGTYYALVVSTSGEGAQGQYLLDAAIWPTGQMTFPDLAISGITAATFASRGATTHLTWMVGNYGTATTGQATWYDQVVLSKNDTFGDSDDTYLASIPHSGSLDPGQQYSAQADVVVPWVPPGNYWVFVKTDVTNIVSEYLFENNNTRRSDGQLDVNAEPTAVAGGPYTIGQSQPLVLDASGSSDPENDPLTYAWDINGDGNYTDATGVSPTLSWTRLQALGLATPGVYSNLRVRVDDGQGGSTISAATSLTVLPNDPPNASAGGPYIIGQGSSLTLSASESSDPDGDPLAYAWDVNGDGNYADATGVNPTLSWVQLQALGLSAPGAYSNVRVRVDDDHNNSAVSAATNLTVLPNRPPDASAGGPYVIQQGLPLTLSAAASFDPDNDPLTYAWDLNGDGNYTDATGVSPAVSWLQLQVLGIATPGVYSNLRVQADDGHGYSPVSAATQLTILWAGDANGDGTVNFKDYIALEANFGKASMTWTQGDFDGNGTVNFRDYIILEANFGKSISLPAPAPVPAPLSTSLSAAPAKAISASQNVVGPIAPVALQQRSGATASWSLLKDFKKVDASVINDLLAAGRLI